MHSVKRTISLLLFSLVLANPVMAVTADGIKQPAATQSAASLYTTIKSIYLPAIGMLADEAMPNANQNAEPASSSWFSWGKKEQKLDLTIQPMTEAEKKTMAFDLLASRDHTQPSGFLSEHSWEDLELFKQANLLRTINRTHTSFGEAVLGKMLVTGGDVNVALARQAAIKELVANEAELKQIDTMLMVAGKSEEIYLSNFKEEDPAYEEYFAKLYFGKWTSKILSNENPILLEAKTRYDDLSNAVAMAGASLAMTVLPTAAAITMLKAGCLKYAPYGTPAARVFCAKQMADEWYTRNNKKFDDELSFQEQMAMMADISRAQHIPQEEAHSRAKDALSYSSLKNLFLPQILSFEKKIYDKQAAKINSLNYYSPQEKQLELKLLRYFMGAVAGITGLMWAITAKAGYDEFKYQFDALKYLQGKLIPLGAAVRAMDHLRETITHSAALRSAMPNELKKLHKLIGGGSGNQKLDELIRLLNTDTFTNTATVLSLSGRILAAHKLMQEVRYELRDALEALGTIDAIASMAKLVKEYETQDNKYCFVNLTTEAQPHLKAVNFWNPLVTMKKPVPNTVELGAQGANRNMILTGQNTAGKSTTLRSLLQGVLLAHVFGVAPAESMDLTPFKLIRTHINISDDVEHGISHFKAEVINIDEIQKAILSLQPGERCFVVIDEIFHTTGPQTAVPLARKYFLGLANYNDVMVISSTHFPELIKLEDETNGVYKNYKMEILKVDGKLVRPHKIEAGWTTANVAEEILAEQGITLFNN